MAKFSAIIILPLLLSSFLGKKDRTRLAVGLGKGILEEYMRKRTATPDGGFWFKKVQKCGCFMIAHVQKMRAKTMSVKPIGYGFYHYACYTQLVPFIGQKIPTYN
jgi:hypothetical protein